MHHLILGAGPAGVIAADTLRQHDPEASITLVSGESEPPYSRMAIPYVLTGRIGGEGTHLRQEVGWYDARGIACRYGRATAVDPTGRRVTLADGTAIGFDRLLIATGARPVRPPIEGLDQAGVHTCWTLEDARAILARAQRGSHVVLLGAGFIGCIVLEALAKRGVRLSVVEMGDRMVPRMMNPLAGTMIKRWCEARGIEVSTSTRITALTPAQPGGIAVQLDDGRALSADLVVISAGVRPNIEFLDGSGIATRRGVVVDDRMRTSQPDIYAAGDVCEGKDISTGGFDIHAIQPTASEHGRVAAMNMAGLDVPYQGSLQMNVLDTVGLISSSFGLWMGVDGGDHAEVVDHDGYRYLRLEFSGDQLVGATAIGLTQHVGALRGLIQTGVALGKWKQRLRLDPHRVMEAYVACTQT